MEKTIDFDGEHFIIAEKPKVGTYIPPKLLKIAIRQMMNLQDKIVDIDGGECWKPKMCVQLRELILLMIPNEFEGFKNSDNKIELMIAKKTVELAWYILQQKRENEFM